MTTDNKERLGAKIQPLGVGVDALVDIAVDAITVGRDVKEQLKDGFQILTDIPIIVFKDFGKIQNIASKAKPAWAEIKDLKPGEITDFEARVSKATGLPTDQVWGKVRLSLRTVDRIYRWGQEGLEIFEDAKDIFSDN